MKIALIGYGKMGHAIERIALERGHEIVARIDLDSRQDLDSDGFKSADVAIEFSTPATAVENYRACFDRGIKVVSGTTGWTARKEEVEELCRKTGGTFFWSSNFSIGVNILFALNRFLAKMMNNFPQYSCSITETHHIHKLDHPSGTAITLAEQVEEESSRYDRWSENTDCGADTVRIESLREGEVPGIHVVRWDSPVDFVELTHSARSRDGFALGAVMAAEWSADRSGVLTMDEMMESMMGN